MFLQPLIQKSSNPVLAVEQLQGLVAELNEQNQETISGGYRFPCDGPGRGGTCQVSGWDHVFLGTVKNS